MLIIITLTLVVILFIICIYLWVTSRRKKKTPIVSNERLEMKTTNVDKGRTMRIGNLIDAWYFGSLGSKERKKEFHIMQNECGKESFGLYLRLDSSLKTQLSKSTRAELVKRADEFWAVYDYSNVLKCLHVFGPTLRAQMFAFAKLHRPELLDPVPYDCIIHYRIGDFLKLGQLIDPKSVVEACVQLRPRYIGVMDGGMSFNTDEDIRKSSNEVKQSLKDMLKNSLPDAKVEDCEAGDTDRDFFKCALAPLLVTAGGSFAICAAIASKGKVRTPACVNTNDCKVSSRPQEIRKGWTTFAYSNYEHN